MSDLYLPEGWLNFEYIDKQPAWLIVILGKRQVGKTYGALQTMLRKGYYHMLLRRTTAELDTISASPDLNPYKVYEPEYHVCLFKQAKKLCRICDYILDEEGKAVPQDQRGLATSLAEIAHIRGFNGSAFTDLIFDEFIPEKGVIIRRSEGDSFLNAYTTINGNRELSGKPPLRAWLLANTNRIDSPILEALNLTDDILKMRRKGKEELLTSTGVYILQPDSVRISELRSDTALIKQISKKSEFYGMAQENQFSYDDSPYIRSLPLKGMQPLWGLEDRIYCWNRGDQMYICKASFKKSAAPVYEDSRLGAEQLRMEHLYMKPYYYAGMICFSDLSVLARFKNIFGIT